MPLIDPPLVGERAILVSTGHPQELWRRIEKEAKVGAAELAAIGDAGDLVEENVAAILGSR